MKLKVLALLIPAFLLPLTATQAGEPPAAAIPEGVTPAEATEPGCGNAEAMPLQEVLQDFTPAAMPEEPIFKAGCFGSYGSCQCYKISGQSGCITSGGGSDCTRCCSNLHC